MLVLPAGDAGDDLRVDLDLDFKTACFGGEEKVGERCPKAFMSKGRVAR